MQSKFTLYLKLFNFQKYLYLLVHNFPKEYKYTLGQSIIDTAWETLDSVISANVSSNSLKAEKLIRTSESFDRLKTRLRMAHELKLIPYSKYSYIIKENEGIGNEISGWLNWAKKQA